MHVVRYYPRALDGDGGMTGAVRRWSIGLARAGVRVTLAFEGRGSEQVIDGVRWLPLRHRGRGWWKVAPGIGDVLRDADLLVLHSGWALHNNWAAAAARRGGVPYLLEPRGAYDPHIVRRRRSVKRAWWAVAEGRLVSRARGVHVFFDEEREHLRALEYAGAVVVAPNGIEVPPGAAWDGGSGGYVLWLGRFDPEHKGLDLLLRAVAAIAPAERPRLVLRGPDYYDGTGGGKDSVRALARRLALGPWVTIEESVHGADKWRALEQARGFVYPSRWEAFGNSVAQAVALGVPTLTTPYPLGRFLEARGGAMVAAATPAALADGLRALVGPQAAAVGARGAAVAREALAWDRVAGSWLSQVETLVGSSAPRSAQPAA